MEYCSATVTPDGLVHYGRKGMKWGQHIFSKDNKVRKVYRRNMTATKRNAIERLKEVDAITKEYNDAATKYGDANSKIAITRKGRLNKMMAVEAAKKDLTNKGEILLNSKASLKEAMDTYNAHADKYVKQVRHMIDDLGDTWVKDVSHYTYMAGTEYATKFIKSGINLANFPVIGQIYTGTYLSNLEVSRRKNNIDDAASKKADTNKKKY